jgi:catechol 2,3-dioxygenase
MVFFKLADRPGERPQTLALFAERWPPNVPGAPWTGLEASTTTMHHFALSVSLPSLLRAAELLASARVLTFERTFAWAGWRSLMIADPESNVVELVALDPSLREANSN